MTPGAWRMSRYLNALRFVLSRQANAYAVTLIVFTPGPGSG
jgi:hypothetical protein